MYRKKRYWPLALSVWSSSLQCFVKAIEVWIYLEMYFWSWREFFLTKEPLAAYQSYWLRYTNLLVGLPKILFVCWIHIFSKLIFTRTDLYIICILTTTLKQSEIFFLIYRDRSVCYYLTKCSYGQETIRRYNLIYLTNVNKTQNVSSVSFTLSSETLWSIWSSIIRRYLVNWRYWAEEL